jgi:hypothetical protein
VAALAKAMMQSVESNPSNNAEANGSSATRVNGDQPLSRVEHIQLS